MVGENLKLEDLVSSLQKLEYRGYDSAGIAYLQKDHFDVYKRRGKIDVLRNGLKQKLKDSSCWDRSHQVGNARRTQRCECPSSHGL